MNTQKHSAICQHEGVIIYILYKLAALIMLAMNVIEAASFKAKAPLQSHASVHLHLLSISAEISAACYSNEQLPELAYVQFLEVLCHSTVTVKLPSPFHVLIHT